MVIAAMKLKDVLSLEKSYDQLRQHIKKQRHYFADKGPMTNLDSILESRDIILPTKVHLVKDMVFPVVMYGCESWTIKKAEC